MKKEFKLTTRLQVYYADRATWFYVLLGKKLSIKLRRIFSQKNEWPRIKIKVSMKNFNWLSYLLKYEDAYCIPINEEIVQSEKLKEGDKIELEFESI